MRIRNKILVYFSSTVTTLSAVSLVIIYILFSEYREEEFQQRQKQKIQFTIELLTEYKEMSQNLAEIMDKLTIHDFYDEKMLVFDMQKDLVYTSVDDLPITNYNSILNELSPAKRWIETKEGKYDIIGVYIENNQDHFYAISKAYDAFGYSQMYFLRNTLIGIFISITVLVILVSLWLSNTISKPITALADSLNTYDPNGEKPAKIAVETSSFELQHLTERFNELLKRTNEAFAFQKQAIHHISHELKTPIAILVSELEKTKSKITDTELQTLFDGQIAKAKSLGEIINILLEIAKIEAGQNILKQPVRIDEILFDIIQELNTIYPDFHFEVNYTPAETDEKKLILNANKMLIKQALQNLLINCVAYSDSPKAKIEIHSSDKENLSLLISNTGKPISKQEEKYLFSHFFRGANSQGKIGFGLGLVFTQKIIRLNSGTISYHNPQKNLNVFEIRFSVPPL